MAAAKTRTIRLQTYVRAPPSKAFRWISEPKLLARWMVDQATLPPRRGARYSFSWEGGPTHTGTVLEYISGKRISLTWQWPGMEEELRTRLVLSIARKAGGTVLKFTHSGFPTQERWVDLYGGAIQGWTYFLLNFKSVVDHGRDLRSPHDW